ncbi:MAG: nitrate reductase subunit alpha [Betaproteobacteria bacterium]
MSQTAADLKWIKDESRPVSRRWEEFYRNRWQHDRVVRSTHGVNCTGGCSWNVYVKDGIVTWEMQALDYPAIAPDLPAYEPRGCQRGMSCSWYLYSPLRVKHPYARGVLLDAWTRARAAYADPVDAWASIVEDETTRRQWHTARGKGGFVRASWDTLVELIAAATIYTIKKHGPDRIAGFSPIPAMSMISYAAGARFLQLIGGVSMSFYDWYCDLPSASPETWGEQTDVHESADWYNARLIAVVGSNVSLTRTPDAHFAAEARHNGSKVWVFSPDFSQMSRFADEWVPVGAGQDGAWWMAVTHVLLGEFHHRRRVPAFLDYCRRYTDAPYLVELTPSAQPSAESAEAAARYRPGQLVRAQALAPYAGVENGAWKFLMWDEVDQRPKMPMGSVGFRWGSEAGQWNLTLRDGADGSDIHPTLSFLDLDHDVALAEFDDFERGTTRVRGVPVKRVLCADGTERLVTTVYDLLMAQYGVVRGLPGDYPASDDEDGPYTPAWAERLTGAGRDTLLRFAREWGETAERTGGRCLLLIGAGVNHWYHGNLIYRPAIHALMLCGCVGVNGGGMGHYVGQEKLSPMEPWSAIAFARDWMPAPRLQNSPSWHYVHSDQWRYERAFTSYHPVPGAQPANTLAAGHTMDVQVRAVRNGWLPFYPQFDRNPLDLVREAQEAGASTPDAVIARVVSQLEEKSLRFAVEDPDAPENWPRLWFIWRGNALMASAKGHEYFLKHYLGTHNHVIAPDAAAGDVHEVQWRTPAPEGKMDLVVDLNFRMDTSALYSDIVLPAATWYEKSDLNSTDLHTFIHPLSAAVPPSWESKSDWAIFKAIAARFSELAAGHFTGPVDDIVATPLAHDTPAEMAQPAIKDWSRGEVAAVPGKTMPGLKVVTRDYRQVHRQFIAFGPLARANGLGAHGTQYDIADVYDDALQTLPTVTWDGRRYPSLDADEHVCDVILRFATVTNGELAYRSYTNMERKVGLPLAHLASGNRASRVSFADLQAQPHRVGNSPMWSGIIDRGRAYSPFTVNVECQVPWRTLTGRQHFYLDHPGYLQFGEHLPTFKPTPAPAGADLGRTLATGGGLELRFLTPHGKWHIHSTYGDNPQMTTLSRGGEPLWMNDADAARIGVADNDWVEVLNDHGVVVTRVAVSARIPRGLCFQYHSPERTIGVPTSPSRGGRRAGAHNSLTRAKLKPNLMVGGYGQFTYHFNYWGPVGINRETEVVVRRLADVTW